MSSLYNLMMRAAAILVATVSVLQIIADNFPPASG